MSLVPCHLLHLSLEGVYGYGSAGTISQWALLILISLCNNWDQLLESQGTSLRSS